MNFSQNFPEVEKSQASHLQKLVHQISEFTEINGWMLRGYNRYKWPTNILNKFFDFRVYRQTNIFLFQIIHHANLVKNIIRITIISKISSNSRRQYGPLSVFIIFYPLKLKIQLMAKF